MKLNSKKFRNHQEMSQSATNWEHHCSYKLFPYAYEGEHHVITLPNTQLSYSSRKGGFMHDAFSPADAISIAVILECQEAACFDTFKLHKGMILVFDDSKAFNFMSKGEISIAIISLPTTLCQSLALEFKPYFGHYVEDANGALSARFKTTLADYHDPEKMVDAVQTENEFITLLRVLTQEHAMKEMHLTKGERIALKIRDEVYHHMDGKINIDSFAKKYAVSDQTLQNAFRSLFGFTPKQFLMRLKLNLVHHDLQKHQPQSMTVQAIASKWGFSHMSRFARTYLELFEEKPSETLQKGKLLEENMTKGCVSRQEEIV